MSSIHTGLIQAQEITQLIQNYSDLKNLGLNVQADAVKGILNNLIGVNTQVTPPTEGYPETEENDVYIVFNGSRGTGKSMLSDLINTSLSQFGLTVKKIEGQEDTLHVVNPRGNPQAKPEAGDTLDTLCARHKRIKALLGELKKLGVAVFPA